MSKKQKHTIEVQDNGYIKRLPKAIVIGAKKSGTSKYQVDENYEKLLGCAVSHVHDVSFSNSVLLV